MMYVKKFLSILGLLFVTIAISVLFSSCDILDAIIGNADTDIGTETDVVPNESKEHIHNFSMWEMTTQPSCTVNGMQTRVCTLCGFSEYSPISAFGHTEVTDKAVAPNCTQTGLTEGTHCSVCNETLKAQDVVKALGHTEVEDSAVSPTCLVDGKTAGSHCSVCNTIIIAQTVVSARGHTSITDPAIAATCTTDGKTEGAHCGVCQLTLVEQTTIKAQGHQYDEGVIVTAATCIQVGTKKYTCTVSTCSHFYNETYSMQTFTATELYNQSVKYVGEIVTYDKSGNEYALGTGFVYSTDGKIITNYHVIDGAYSATITINNSTVKIE